MSLIAPYSSMETNRDERETSSIQMETIVTPQKKSFSAMSTIGKKFIGDVIDMIRLYDIFQRSGQQMSPSEFVKSNYCEKKLFVNEMKESCFAMFFDICSLRDFLDALCDEKLWPNTNTGITYLYLILFHMTPTNRDVIVESLLEDFSPKSREKMLKFFSREEIFNIIENKAVEVYEDHFKRDYILKEVKERASMITHLRVAFERIKRQQKLKSINFSIKNGYQILSDFNSPGDEITVTIPEVCSKSETISQAKSSSHNLMMPSKQKMPLPSACSTTLESIMETSRTNSSFDEPDKMSKDLEKQGDCHQTPRVKQTIAQVLREGARVKKKAEQAENVFKDLCKGSTDPYKIQAMLEVIREEENEAELREIERKHLLGRISQEEARLAKLAVQKSNQRKAAQLKKERQNLEIKLAEYRQQEEARLKELAEKSHGNLELIKQAQANLLNQKKQTAKEIQEESRQMQVIIDQRKREELNYKINLIRQIKELEQASKASFNRDTSSKTALSIGTSYAMSLNELKEALVNLKARIQEELAQRRENIQREKLRHQAVIQDAKETIQRYKNINKKPIKLSSSKELKLTPELIKLRKKLKQKQAQAARLESSF